MFFNPYSHLNGPRSSLSQLNTSQANSQSTPQNRTPYRPFLPLRPLIPMNHLATASPMNPVPPSNSRMQAILQRNGLREVDLEATRLELETLGFDVYKVTNGGDTVLHQAVRKGNLRAVQLAIAYGCDINRPNKAGDTPLHIGAEKGHLEIVQYLIGAGANPDTKNHLGQLPFHKGLQHSALVLYFESLGYKKTGSFEEYAIVQGLQPGLVDNQGNTFMHKLVLSKNSLLMRKVLEEKFQLDLLDKKNKKGFTPFDLAIQQKDTQIVKLFIDHAQTRSIRYVSLRQAALAGWKEGLELLLPFFNRAELLNRGTASARHPATLLHQAAYAGDLPTVQFLVNYGFSINEHNYSVYQPQITKQLSDRDLDTLAELDHFNSYRPQILQYAGYIDPVLSPLSIALYFHPEKQYLADYLKMAGGTEHFQSSMKGIKPESLFLRPEEDLWLDCLMLNNPSGSMNYAF